MSHKRSKQRRKILAAIKTQEDSRTRSKGPWIDPCDQIANHPMCHDCAFRHDSKEMLAYQYGVSEIGGDDGPPVIATVGHTISRALDGKAKFAPFFCHHFRDGRDVPVDENGRYKMELNKSGHPKNAPVCNGWKAMVERHRRVREADEPHTKRPTSKIPKLLHEAENIISDETK